VVQRQPSLSTGVSRRPVRGWRLLAHHIRAGSPTAPSGFDKEHPRGDLLRYKTLTCHREFGAPDWLATKRAQTEVVKAWRAMSPVVAWLDQHVGMD
jgi:hypothetical protein